MFEIIDVLIASGGTDRDCRSGWHLWPVAVALDRSGAGDQRRLSSDALRGKGPGMKRRTKLLVAVAVGVTSLLTAVGVIAVLSRHEAVFADGAGGASADLPGLPFHITAQPGTFPAHQRLTIEPVDMTADKGHGKLVTTAITFSNDGQPAHRLLSKPATPIVSTQT